VQGRTGEQQRRRPEEQTGQQSTENEKIFTDIKGTEIFKKYVQIT
jgi:hypothetical protein